MLPEITNIEPNVDKITFGDKEIYLVGTAHISKHSAELASRIIETVQPDAVAIELCKARYESLKDPESWKKTDIIKVLKDGKAAVLFLQLMLASFQKRMGEKLQVKPGLEMLEASNTAKKIGASIILADRDVKTTLRRSWSKVSFISLIKLMWGSIIASWKGNDITEEEIELLKTGDALDALIKEFSEALPDIKEPLIDERDRYLTEKIQNTSYKKIVAVVGAGHTPGMKRLFGTEINITPLDEIPPPALSTKLIGWLFPISILSLFIGGFFYSGASTSLEMAKYWALCTGIAAGAGALICLSHPLTILSAIFAAPITTLHPFLAAGWIAGLVEAWLRKPTVADFDSIANDLVSIRGIWGNRLSRVFLVMMLTNIGATVGMAWGTKVLITLLGN